MKDTERLIAIVSDLKAGKSEAAADLYTACHEDVYYYILKTVNDPELAADLTQDTFIEIIETIDKLQEPAAFVVWCRQIAYHKCTAHFRKRSELLVAENEDGQTIFDTIVEEREEFIPDEALEKRDLRQIIHRMINDLPEEQRTAIMMRYFDELSVKQIAKIQAVSEGTVKSRLNYGRKAIKQSVKDYEKKNGIKLRCVGIIPLLLWLLKKSGGLDTSASATTIAKEGIKAVGKLTAKKVVAGIAAATVVTGGVTAGVLLKEKPEQPLMQWYGYGTIYNTTTRRFDLDIDSMNDAHIAGTLEVSHLYEITHTTKFEGVGEVSGDSVIYTLDFEHPAIVGTIPTYEYYEIQLEYNKKTEQFIFDDYYRAYLERAKSEKSKLLAKDTCWSGYGEDNFYSSLKRDHLFTLEVNELREEEISGKLTVSYDGQIDHESEFIGRGHLVGGEIYYEILLDTARTEYSIIEITVDRLWLIYDLQSETFKTEIIAIYETTMEKVES